jgi:hypothetical protein
VGLYFVAILHEAPPAPLRRPPLISQQGIELCLCLSPFLVCTVALCSKIRDHLVPHANRGGGGLEPGLQHRDLGRGIMWSGCV